MIHLRRTIFLLATFLSSIAIHAQWEHYGGVYAAYPKPENVVHTPAPQGYQPFYVSMFARHGSRWLPDDRRYDAIDSVFADTLNLTPLGRDVRRRLMLIHEDARGRGGGLTAIGAIQHRGLAERMVANFPEVFADNAKVEARSSTVGRCAMSMAAFTIRLAQLCPSLDITAETGQRYMAYIAYTSPEEYALEAVTDNEWAIQPERLMRSLFVHPERVASWRDVAQELHTIASDTQNTGTGISLYDLFTEEEMQQIYDMNNRRMQLCNGINPSNNGIPQRCAESLWRNIVESADSAIACGQPVAHLRFGHDTSLYRLYSRMGLFADEQCMDVIIPMAANLQMVFYRNKKKEVIVKFMHNEREITLPTLEKLRGKDFTLPCPYYRWNDVKRLIP